METFDRKTEMPVSARDLYDWHMQPGGFERLLPPWQKVRVLQGPEVLEEGAKLVMKVYMGPIGVRWVALHRDFVEGRQFVDEQVCGPFAEWVHTHRFEPIDEQTSVLHDHVEYRLPMGAVGRLFGGVPTGHMLERMFEFRHHATFEALSVATPALDQPGTGP
jgi:ligand-binding SRPBCC domain-containing protein